MRNEDAPSDTEESHEVWPNSPWRGVSENSLPWLYVVADEMADKMHNPCSWTLSPDPGVPGWETDCGISRYGLPRAIAESIAARCNAGLYEQEAQ